MALLIIDLEPPDWLVWLALHQLVVLIGGVYVLCGQHYEDTETLRSAALVQHKHGSFHYIDPFDVKYSSILLSGLLPMLVLLCKVNPLGS